MSFSTSSGASSGTKWPAFTWVNFAFGIILDILSAYVGGDFPIPQIISVGTFSRERPCSISFIGLKLGCVGESGNIPGNAWQAFFASSSGTGDQYAPMELSGSFSAA